MMNYAAGAFSGYSFGTRQFEMCFVIVGIFEFLDLFVTLNNVNQKKHQERRRRGPGPVEYLRAVPGIKSDLRWSRFDDFKVILGPLYKANCSEA